jgi:hypothetical protein
VKGNSLSSSEPGIRFHALTFSQELFGLNAVNYTAVAVAHPRSQGVFKLAWNHLASPGGALGSGNVVVVPQASS